MIEPVYSKEHIRAALEPKPSGPEDDMLWIAGSREAQERMRASIPERPLLPAAVLVPLVEREAGRLTVLLTQRAATLNNHAGQISFPGGRIELTDPDPWHAALREAREEIGLSARFVEFAGYMPVHWVGTGFRVTPVVGFVNPQFELSIDQDEVHDVFEVPLEFILDAANHQPRTRTYGVVTVETFDIPWGDRVIWGATAGMLLTFRRLLQAKR